MSTQYGISIILLGSAYLFGSVLLGIGEAKTAMQDQQRFASQMRGTITAIAADEPAVTITTERTFPGLPSGLRFRLVVPPELQGRVQELEQEAVFFSYTLNESRGQELTALEPASETNPTP